MSVIEPTPVRSSPLVARVKAILLSPKTEWDRIDLEPATIAGLYTGYVVILAAIPVLANLIGGLVFGYGGFGFSWRPSLTSSIVTAVVSYVLSLASVYIMALIIDALAPSFDGQKNQIQAFKVATYASTAAWVVGIFGIFPPLAVLGILGLYSLYLYYLGLPRLMKVPESKALGYTAVTILAAVVVFLVIGLVSSSMLRWTGGGYPVAARGALFGSPGAGQVSGTVNIGGGSVDLAKLAAASQAIQASANQLQAQQAGGAPASVTAAGAIKPVSGDALKALLPASLSGLPRSEVSANSAAVGAVSGSEAEGVYTAADRRISLQVTDMGAMGALATLGGAVAVNSSKQTATGYEKVTTVNGRMTDEEYDNTSKSGKYSVMVASRFMVEANGDGVGMDDLKGAVGAIDMSALEGLAKG